MNKNKNSLAELFWFNHLDIDLWMWSPKNLCASVLYRSKGKMTGKPKHSRQDYTDLENCTHLNKGSGLYDHSPLLLVPIQSTLPCTQPVSFSIHKSTHHTLVYPSDRDMHSFLLTRPSAESLLHIPLTTENRIFSLLWHNRVYIAILFHHWVSDAQTSAETWI